MNFYIIRQPHLPQKNEAFKTDGEYEECPQWFCQDWFVQTNVPLLQQKLYHKDQEVQNHMQLSAAGVHENAVLTLVNSSAAPSR